MPVHERFATHAGAGADRRPDRTRLARGMSRWPLQAAACICLLWTGAALAVVFGEDQRRPPTAAEQAADTYGFVGELVCRSAWINLHHATGVLVDVPGHPEFAGVLTVAHALRDGRRDKDYSGCRYRPRGEGWWAGVPLLAVAHGDFDESYARNEQDWALALIDAQAVVGVPRVRPALAEAAETQSAVAAGATLAVVGLPEDRSGIAIAESCRARPPQAGELLFGQQMWLSDCDQVEGASGAPLIARDLQGEIKVLGLYRGPVFTAGTYGKRPPDRVKAFDAHGVANAIVPVTAEMLERLARLAQERSVSNSEE